MLKINTNMQWLIPLAAATWAVWTWAADNKRERKKERARIAALYVNPFLSACEDLQSRIYNILELGGLRSLRKRYSDGAFAEETLYLIVRYFGWATAVERHGPYTQDPVVMRLASAARGAFAASQSPQQVGAFNFFHPEQKALGKLVMTRVRGQHGIELDTISSYDFKKFLASPPLSESESVKETLDALRSANDAESLPGRDRLATVQHHIVELINYIEGKEGYSLFTGERKQCRAPMPLAPAEGNKSLPGMSG